MDDKNLRNIYPIAWTTESKTLIAFIQKWNSSSEDNLLIADFASGEYDRVPTFFTNVLPDMLGITIDNEKRIVVYCTDIHSLRLDSLLGKLEEENKLDNIRVVHSALETMDINAELREQSLEFILKNPETATWLDDFLIGEKRFPSECFDIGILNTDVIGYLFEYYKEYSDAEKALSKVFEMIRKGGLLVVTMPCQQYKVDNVSIMEKTGFTFQEGLDITLSNGKKTLLEKDVPLEELSRLGHYTYLIFSTDPD
jgi:hypothetical protein